MSYEHHLSEVIHGPCAHADQGPWCLVVCDQSQEVVLLPDEGVVLLPDQKQVLLPDQKQVLLPDQEQVLLPDQEADPGLQLTCKDILIVLHTVVSIIFSTNFYTKELL